MNQSISTTLDRSIRNIAPDHRLYYTRRQLYYEVCRLLRPSLHMSREMPVFAGAFAIPSLFLSRTMRHPMAKLGSVAVWGSIALWLDRMRPYTLTVPYSYDDFLHDFDHYCAMYGSPLGLIHDSDGTTGGHAPLLRREGGDAAGEHAPLFHTAGEYDLFDYGVARVLICQDESIVQMLRANMFHMDMKCSILSLKEATPLPDWLLEPLQRTTEASCFYLHHASSDGMSVIPSLRSCLNLPNHIACIPIGIRPIHAWRLRLFANRTSSPPADTLCNRVSYLLPHERFWLQRGWQADIAALHPSELLLRLRRIISGSAYKPPFRFNPWYDQRIGFMTLPPH